MEALLKVIRHIDHDAATFGTSGNVSARSSEDPDAFLITPSGVKWGDIGADQIVRLSVRDGGVLEGSLVPSTEWQFHQKLYHSHPWIGGIIHLHAQYATILSTIATPIRAVHYQMARVGDEVPVLPYFTFGTLQLAEAIADAINPSRQALLLQNHGLVVVGDSVDGAYRAAQEVEWTAMIQYHAMLVQPPRVLTHEELENARRAFQRYGQTRPT